MPACSGPGDAPFYTVIIPTYRRNKLLVEALASVSDQTFDDFEVLVVDDFGDPTTGQLVDELGDPRFRYLVNLRSSGGSGARNFGLAHATGEWVAFLDDDDTWLPNKLKAVYDLIVRSADPLLGMVYSGNVKYDFENEAVVSRVQPRDRGMILSRLLYENCVGGMSVVVAKRELLQHIGGFDERFPAMQDMELFVRLGQHNTIDFVSEALVRIRWSGRERITVNPRKKLEGARLFAEKYQHLMQGDLGLRHRTAARTFVFAVAADDFGQALRSLPWTLAGIVVDPANMLYVVGAIARHFRSRRKRTSATVRAGAP